MDFFHEQGWNGEMVRPAQVKIHVPETTTKCVETVTNALAGIGFAWEPYVLVVMADLEDWSKHKKAARYGLIYLLGM